MPWALCFGFITKKSMVLPFLLSLKTLANALHNREVTVSQRAQATGRGRSTLPCMQKPNETVPGGSLGCLPLGWQSSVAGTLQGEKHLVTILD